MQENKNIKTFNELAGDLPRDGGRGDVGDDDGFSRARRRAETLQE